MKKIDFENKILQYIDDELSNQDRIEFEEAMKNNQSLKGIFNDILYNDQLLKNLPKIKTSPNFMLNLNKKIDNYNHRRSNNWYNSIKDFMINIKPAPAFSIACVALITCFSVIKISGYDLFPGFFSYPDHEYNIDLNNYIAINDSDSLNTYNDSLSAPTLLIGNDR